MELVGLSFLPDEIALPQTLATYQQVVDDFGPDDFNTLMKQAYTKGSELLSA